MVYTTVSGDTFDLVAYKIYGSCRRVKTLMQANSQYLDILVFPAGIVLDVPELGNEAAVSDSLPPWRKALEGGNG